MRYKYKQSPLPDGGVDWIAILHILISKGSKRTSPFEALIDSGSTNCLFHGDIVVVIGIADFKTGKHHETGGVVAGSKMDAYEHEVRLHIGADSFKIIGHFSENLPYPCILGRRYFFDSYIVTFDPSETNPGFELTRVHRA